MAYTPVKSCSFCHFRRCWPGHTLIRTLRVLDLDHADSPRVVTCLIKAWELETKLVSAGWFQCWNELLNKELTFGAKLALYRSGKCFYKQCFCRMRERKRRYRMNYIRLVRCSTKHYLPLDELRKAVAGVVRNTLYLWIWERSHAQNKEKGNERLKRA